VISRASSLQDVSSPSLEIPHDVEIARRSRPTASPTMTQRDAGGTWGLPSGTRNDAIHR
jgi:hypothetical protein